MLDSEEVRRRFIKNLKFYIHENETNKLSLSKKIGCDSSLISKWEKGEASPTLDYIYRLTFVLKITFEDLIGE